jgi:hypothetical protein
MLRIWNYEYRDPMIQSGLAYLCNAVQEHTQPQDVEGNGRGELARYPAYAIWGLTRFPETAFDRRYREGLAFAIDWLNRNSLTEGGWPAALTGDFSFTVTMPAVRGLDRICRHPSYGKGASRLAAAARIALMRSNRGGSSQAWWTPYGDGAPPSAAATAMAVLILVGGNHAQRDVARSGVSWLLSNPNEWVDRIEPDMQIEDRAWQMMSFSLVIRAVMHPAAKVSPRTPVLRQAIHFFDELWVEQVGAWSHYRGGIASTTGSFAVIAAVHALKRAFEFDPIVHLETGHRDGPGRSTRRRVPRARLRLELASQDRMVRILNQHDETMVDCRIQGDSQWRVLEVVAMHHLEAEAQHDQMAQTIALDDLAAKVGTTTGATVKAISRVNKQLTRLADQNHNQFLPALIEDVRPKGSSGHRYGLEELDVVVVPDSPGRLSGQPSSPSEDSP